MSLLQGVFPFKPNHLGVALTVWFDAADSRTITESGGLVSAWGDKSGNGNHAVQSSGALQPTLVGNAVDFDGSNILQVTNDPFNGLQDFGVIAVYHVDVTSNWSNALASMNGDPSYGWQMRQKGANINDRAFSRDGVPNVDFFNTISDATTDFIGAYYRDSSNVSYIRHDGNADGSNSDGGPIPYTGLSNRSAIGGRYNTNDWVNIAGQLDGAIKEIIVFENTSLEKVQKVEGYIAWKWGLEASLPVGHPYKTSPPTV